MKPVSLSTAVCRPYGVWPPLFSVFRAPSFGPRVRASQRYKFVFCFLLLLLVLACVCAVA